MMTPETKDDAKKLEIHVLGAGKGESIVIRCPDGVWGVVDCYASDLKDQDTNGTLRFLKSRGVSSLGFLCLTHPHDDHYRGMSQLLNALSVKEFWRFSGTGGKYLLHVANYLRLDARKSEVGEYKDDADDFLKTMALVQQRQKNKQIRVVMVTSHAPLYPVPADPGAPFQIWSFAPSGDQVANYERALGKCFEGDRFRTPIPQVNHNLVSVGLYLQFGSTRVILGGDVERQGWGDAREYLNRDTLSADAVKVSHHGSETGYIDGLWGDHAKKKKPIAIIAPYRLHKLPRPKAIEHIRTHVSQLFVTCSAEFTNVPGPAKPLESKLALRAELRIHPPPAETGCGRCSLVFDNAGNSTVTCDGPAYEWKESK